MKIRALLILLAITLILLLARDANAASVGVYFDAQGTQSTSVATPFVQFKFYILAHGLGATEAYEVRAEISDPQLMVVNTTYAGPPCLICLPEEDYIRTLGGCLSEPSNPFQLVEFDVSYFSSPVPEDVTVCVRPTSLSEYAFPSTFDCDGGSHPLAYSQRDVCGVYDDGCAVLNPSSGFGNCVIGAEETSLATIKSRWR